MSFLQSNILAMLAGFVLDLLIGDPEGWPHPVIWIGKYIGAAEKHIRARCRRLRRGAVLLTASTVILAMTGAALALWLLFLISPWAYLAGAAVLSWWALSARCLAKEGTGVRKALEVSLDAGRRQVGRIVGRDTGELSAGEVIRAAVETVAENTTDGVVAPMLYLALGGPVLGMGFKAASTLDSMVGYLDDRYRDIGWSSAKLDDVLNYIPARLCGALLCLSAWLCRLDGRAAFRIMLRDHGNHLSPNCAWSEAAVAGALGVQLGGTHMYFGKPVEKPSIGDDTRTIVPRDIDKTNRLMYTAACLLAVLLGALGLIV